MCWSYEMRGDEDDSYDISWYRKGISKELKYVFKGNLKKLCQLLTLGQNFFFQSL